MLLISSEFIKIYNIYNIYIIYKVHDIRNRGWYIGFFCFYNSWPIRRPICQQIKRWSVLEREQSELGETRDLIELKDSLTFAANFLKQAFDLPVTGVMANATNAMIVF